jgi:uncharacterized protein (TIGR02145 family)
VVLEIALFASAVLLMALTFHSCQKEEEMILETEEIGLKSDPISEITLIYPMNDVNAGEDFTITFSSSCGKIMIERGFIGEVDEYGEIINKVYTGLSCETENLLWEEIDDTGYADCQGGSITGNLAEAGTYVYRAKLNFKAKNNSGCADCGTFVGNQYECFMITVVAGGGNENEGTFTDARDNKVYKWVKIGDQVWMAENLAYNLAGSRAYNDDEANAAIYGRLYTRAQAIGDVCPAGWHLPSIAEWETLINYIVANSAVYGNVAKALASKTLWHEWFLPNYPIPGSSPELNNSSGFNALPAGRYTYAWNQYDSETYRTEFWSSDPGDIFEDLPNYVGIIWDVDHVFTAFGSPVDGLSIRCVKDAE